MRHIGPATIEQAFRAAQATRECAHTMSAERFRRRTTRWALLAGAACLALSTLACGDSGTTGNPTPTPTPALTPTPTPTPSLVGFVYSANSNSHNLSGFALRSDGTLNAIAGSPF
jgi:hypothetical protein